jgi:hypothetical protein
MMQEQMMQQQQMQQAPQQQMQQQGGQEQMMQMVQQVAQMLMQGAPPEQIMQQLIQAGVPQEQAQQIIQVAMQELQSQQQQQQPMQQGQQPMQGQEQMMPQQGMMSSGGKLPREILRARAESHMSSREAANYVNNYSTGGRMRYDGGGKKTNDIYTPSYGTQYLEYDEYGNPTSYDSSYGTNIPATPTASMGEFYDQFTGSDLMYDNYLKGAVPNSGPLANNQLTKDDKAALAFQEKYSQPGQMTADLIDNTKGNKSNKGGMRGTLSKAPINTFTQNTSDLTPTVYPDSQLNNNNNTNSNNSSNLLSGMGIASGLIGPIAHLINNKKPKPFNYVKPTPTTLNPTSALAVARKFANDKYNSAAYTIKQNAPTSGSHLANTLVNARQSGFTDAATGAGIQSQYDRENANIYNTFAQNNAAIDNKKIDEMRADKGNYATQNANAFYNLGANMQGSIRDIKEGKINDLIANNIGTSNYKLVGNKIIYELNGKTIVKSIDDLQTPTNDFT